MFSWFKKKLDDNGERMDIDYYHMNYERFDVYQKSHYKRYQYAQTFVDETDVCADFACGSGYGSMMLSEKASEVVGVDLNTRVIGIISKKYRKHNKVTFLCDNLLNIQYKDKFDTLVSFETIEHLKEEYIPSLFLIFANSLKKGGLFIFSTPYNQEKSDAAIKMGFHLTFYIVEETVQKWLNEAGFIIETVKYQNYESHELVDELDLKDFIICTARKL